MGDGVCPRILKRDLGMKPHAVPCQLCWDGPKNDVYVTGVDEYVGNGMIGIGFCTSGQMMGRQMAQRCTHSGIVA